MIIAAAGKMQFVVSRNLSDQFRFNRTEHTVIPLDTIQPGGSQVFCNPAEPGTFVAFTVNGMRPYGNTSCPVNGIYCLVDGRKFAGDIRRTAVSQKTVKDLLAVCKTELQQMTGKMGTSDSRGIPSGKSLIAPVGGVSQNIEFHPDLLIAAAAHFTLFGKVFSQCF